MTHQEYTTKFNKMARLLPDMVKPESIRIDRYIFGLPRDIKKHVISARPTTFSSVADLSRILYLERGTVPATENRKKWEGKSWKSSAKRGRVDQQSERNQKKGKVEEITDCWKCVKKHGRDYRAG
jgi:hypothetical protein